MKKKKSVKKQGQNIWPKRNQAYISFLFHCSSSIVIFICPVQTLLVIFPTVEKKRIERKKKYEGLEF